jgi:capsular exopolysaccharide synthesis family protein
MLGLLLAAGGALLLENLRDTVRFPDQLLSRFGVASLGTVFEWLPDEIGQSEIVLLDAPDSGYAEAFRQIRINIQFVTDNLSGNVILVSSPGPAEGKSTIITNLAVSIAQAGKRVVLVDGDMRRPSLHGFFDSVARESGLSNYLASIDIDSRNALETVIHATGVEDAYLIPSGPSPPNPAELLGLPLMSGLLAELRDRFDVVLVDSPPLLLVADGSVIAPQVDGAILVVDGLKTRSYSLDTSLNTLRSSGVTVLGVIINRLKRSRIGDRYRYPDYYRYHSMYDRYYSYSDGAEEDSKVGFYGNRARWARKVWSRFRRG